MNFSIKRFLKTHVINENHPFAFMIFRKLRARQYERNSRMTYAEIEDVISKRYEAMFGRKLDWDNPKTYNEKINVSKIYMPSPLKTMLVDKYLVREWIREKIGGEYLIPLIGVYDSFDEIDFDSLSSQFVMKCNHDSGSVTLVADKSKLDMKALKLKYDFFMSRNYAYHGFEMHYRDIKPKIIIEQYMGEAINDYKFLCFDGKPYYCWVDTDRFTNHARTFYNLNWERQAFSVIYPTNPHDIKRPEHFDKMKEIATFLCQGLPHVRVDLYSIEGHIYFGEMTFTSEGGFGKFTPDEYDYKLGALWPFDNSIRPAILAKYSKPSEL